MHFISFFKDWTYSDRSLSELLAVRRIEFFGTPRSPEEANRWEITQELVEMHQDRVELPNCPTTRIRVESLFARREEEVKKFSILRLLTEFERRLEEELAFDSQLMNL